ncbi:MAG: SUMF1/EgtB/PvdO family nonheme iron enzyme [Gemmataceae bacterium]|nr:SUMF1/EgtB/PvdO family nonheme iron enzyme [Gemmataceae bacterium]
MSAQHCPPADTLEGFVRGSVDDESFDAHLDGCLRCQAAVDELDASLNSPFSRIFGTPLTQEEPAPRYLELAARAKAILATPETDEVRTLGQYLLLETIGAGGMGRVYKAFHQKLKKSVVVKVLGPHAQSEDSRRRFLVEMEAVGRLDSPHVVVAHDAGEENGRPFLVMEHLEGCDLAQRIKRHGVMSIPEAIDCVLQAARGLADAHAAGIVHRDVKPANLLLETNGNLKVLDLGLAALSFNDRGASDSLAGTVAYMAPELFEKGRTADERSDIYSLGCTLHYLLSGQVPFPGTTPTAIVESHRKGVIPSLRQTRPECPLSLELLFRRMISTKPEDRPQSMDEVAKTLESIARPTSKNFNRRWVGVFVACAAAVVVAWIAFGHRAAVIRPDDASDNIERTNVPVAVLPKANPAPSIPMAAIASGEFWMGASDTDRRAHASEKPRRRVKLNVPFLLGKTEVTQAQYEEVMGTNPSAFSSKGRFAERVKGLDTREHPVDSVSWLDAIRFCNRLSERANLPAYYRIANDAVTIVGGNGYRLPTEAEWEYACRAGASSTWSFGEDEQRLTDFAWYAANSLDRPHAVATKNPNAWGLFDMYGNLPEWCWDRYDEQYFARMPASDPPGSGTGRERVYRGDAWNSPLPRTSARPALGGAYGGVGSINIVGFRIARNGEK